MQSEPDILDEGFDPEDRAPKVDDFAPAEIRFLNYLIDSILCLSLTVAVWVLIAKNGNHDIETVLASPWRLSFYGITLLYYIILEGIMGRTLAKILTRTRVVNEFGERPDLRTISLRSLARLVPFEAFSVFGKSPLMWHDSWTNTYVVKTK